MINLHLLCALNTNAEVNFSVRTITPSTCKEALKEAPFLQICKLNESYENKNVMSEVFGNM
jgi:hypothetical protein